MSSASQLAAWRDWLQEVTMAGVPVTLILLDDIECFAAHGELGIGKTGPVSPKEFALTIPIGWLRCSSPCLMRHISQQ